MSLIDEWTPLFPNHDEAARPSTAAGVARRGAAAREKLQERIHAQLMGLAPSPSAVHCYLGEGLRWIRVGFEGDTPLTPAAMLDVARAIESGLDGTEASPLYFHALRPHDMLFFLEGGDADSEGLPPGFYGAPLAQVLGAWNGGGRASRQVRSSSPASSRSAAPNSQRRRSKP